MFAYLKKIVFSTIEFCIVTLFSGHFPHSNPIITLLKNIYNCEAFIKSANLDKINYTEF